MISFTHRHAARRRRAGASIVAFGAILALVSCNDPESLTSPGGLTPRDPSHMVVYCDDPTPDCPAPPPDPTDTHVSADVTYSATSTATLSDYFTDPVTGQYTNVLSVTPADAHVHVEAGYASNGQPRITTSYTDGADAATSAMPQIVNQDLAGDNLTDINPYGYALATTSPDSMQAAPAMDLVGSTANGDITAGVLVSTADTLVSSQSLGATDAPGLSASEARLSRVGGVSEIPPGLAFARASRVGSTATTRLNGIPVRVQAAGPDVLVVEDVTDDASTGVMPSSRTPALDPTGLYTGQRGLAVAYAFERATGALRWRRNLVTDSAFPASVAGLAASGDTIYVAVKKSLDPNGAASKGVLVALDRTAGTELWRYETPGTKDFFLGAPIVVGTTVIVNDFYAGPLIAVDTRTHAEMWRADVTGTVRAVVIGSRVFAAGADTKARAIDIASGVVKWTAETGSGSFGVGGCDDSFFVSAFHLRRYDAATGAITGQADRDAFRDFFSNVATDGTHAYAVAGNGTVAFDCRD